MAREPTASGERECRLSVLFTDHLFGAWHANARIVQWRARPVSMFYNDSGVVVDCNTNGVTVHCIAIRLRNQPYSELDFDSTGGVRESANGARQSRRWRSDGERDCVVAQPSASWTTGGE